MYYLLFKNIINFNQYKMESINPTEGKAITHSLSV